MINGHGDDIFNHPGIRINFSSNVYNHFSHEKLFAHLADHFFLVGNYPEPSPVRVERRLAEQLGLLPEEVMVTNGATEGIYLIAMASQGGRTSIVAPTFSEYADACRMHRHEVRFVSSLQEITDYTDVAWLCNPNNPTGTVTDIETLRQHIRRLPDTVFVIDASYAPFTRQPLLSPTEAATLPNVIMIHSMTKEFAIPGLRIGYLTGPSPLLGRIRALQMPWSVNALAQEAALYLLAHRDDYRLPLDELMNERQRVAEALQHTGLIDVHPSQSHILLCRLRQGTAAQLKHRLATKDGILIRDASNFQGLTPAHFRIAVQSPEENNYFIEKVRSDL